MHLRGLDLACLPRSECSHSGHVLSAGVLLLAECGVCNWVLETWLGVSGIKNIIYSMNEEAR